MEKSISKDNYETLCADWQKRFLQLDTDALIKKLPGIYSDGSRLMIPHFHRRYAVSLQDGSIRCLDSDIPVSLFTKLNIYTLFWYCKDKISDPDGWIPFRDLKDASPFGPAFQRSVIHIFSVNCYFTTTFAALAPVRTM